MLNGGPINPAATTTTPMIDTSITLPNGQSIQGSNSNLGNISSTNGNGAVSVATAGGTGVGTSHFESLNRLSNMLTGMSNNKQEENKQRNIMDIELTREEIERQDKLSRTIYVGNLNPMIQQNHIQDFFSVCGSIEIVKVAGNASQPTVARYAFVEFTNVESARAAYRLSGLFFLVFYFISQCLFVAREWYWNEKD